MKFKKFSYYKQNRKKKEWIWEKSDNANKVLSTISGTPNFLLTSAKFNNSRSFCSWRKSFNSFNSFQFFNRVLVGWVLVHHNLTVLCCCPCLFVTQTCEGLLNISWHLSGAHSFWGKGEKALVSHAVVSTLKPLGQAKLQESRLRQYPIRTGSSIFETRKIHLVSDFIWVHQGKCFSWQWIKKKQSTHPPQSKKS